MEWTHWTQSADFGRSFVKWVQNNCLVGDPKGVGSCPRILNLSSAIGMTLIPPVSARSLRSGHCAMKYFRRSDEIRASGEQETRSLGEPGLGEPS